MNLQEVLRAVPAQFLQEPVQGQQLRGGHRAAVCEEQAHFEPVPGGPELGLALLIVVPVHDLGRRQ